MIEREVQLGGWGNFQRDSCYLSTPVKVDSLRRLLVRDDGRPRIARGAGRSYGDPAAVAGGNVIRLGLKQVLNFDPETGVLECEAGLSLEEIIHRFLPQGWFPAVTPGTHAVTVGGAIAADVHGKNHHVDGSFGEYVREFQLLLASGDMIRCSRESHTDVFWATLGGMGLTGIIISAQLQLHHVASAYVQVAYQRTGGLDETLEVLQDDDRFRFSVAWIDGLAQGEKLGRGVWMPAREATVDDLPAALRADPLKLLPGRTMQAPRWAAAALRPSIMGVFNKLYYARYGKQREQMVDFRSYFFPLDKIRDWNQLYGRAGFVQYQALFPHETYRQGIRELLTLSARKDRPSFLAVIKRMGKASGGMLSFPHPGYTICLDFPVRPGLREFLAELDAVVLACGGRLYLAKDAATSAAAFAQMYPRLVEFQRVMREVDPGGRFASSQSRRLQISADA